ncbi:MAG: alpha/beta hydrolase [Flavobacteriales bacterium]
MDPILHRNNVRVFGRGEQPILFAHGFGCDQNMWRFLTPAFENEYRVILFDYVGSGKADPKAFDADRYGDLQGYAQDVLEVCAALELRDAVFVGHSVSGMIGILASLAAPDLFKELILICPSPCFLNHPPDYVGGFERSDIKELLALMDKNYLNWAHYLAPVVMGNAEKPELTGILEASFCSTDPKTARLFAEATFLSDNRHILSDVNIPSFIIQSLNDAIAPVQVGEYLHRHLPDSTLEILTASGHCPHVSHPARTAELIKAYLHAQATG